MRQTHSSIIIRSQIPNSREGGPFSSKTPLPISLHNGRKCCFFPKKNSIIYSKSMNFAYFPLRQFTEALGVTAKVKSRLQPFLEEVENYNMEWLFQMLMELHTYTVATDCPLPYKFNALVALKILLDTCELPVIIMVEVYFLPHVRRVATYQLQASEKHRGLDYFLAMGYPKGPEVKKLGYNYVRLASEIVTMMAVVKPYRLYRDEELAQASEFVNVLQIMRAQQWREYDVFAFYQVDETIMRESFLRKLKTFTRCEERYYDFFDTYLDKFIRKEYSPKVLDPRKILEAGQVFACSHVLKELKELLKEDKASIKANVLKMFTDFVRWGYIRAAYLIECVGIFEDLVKQARTAKGGKGVFRNIHGSEEQRRNLYYQVVRSLQIWAVCIPKNPMNLMEESRCSLTYKEFLQQHVQVPFSGNIKKIRDECQGNLQKNQLINLLIMKEFKKNDFDASKMRRTSSNLEELINMDKNMTSSVAALIMQAKFINDLAKPEIDSISSLSTSNAPGTHPRLIHIPAKSTTQNLQDNTEPAKQNREPRNKQAFNKHKTVSLSNLLCGGSQNNVVIVDGQRYLPERGGNEENFNDECEQNFKINEVRSPIKGKNAFKSHKVSFKIIQDCQQQTVKQAKQERKNIEQQQMVQFFQETIRSPTTTLNSSHFHLEVIKPSPCRQQTNTINSSATTPNTPNRARQEKASLIYCKQQLGFPTRRNELTVDPFEHRALGRPKRIRNSWEDYLPEDHEDRPNHTPACMTIDFSRFEPYLKDWSDIEGKKGLMRNKDILLKNNKIEIGFILQPRTHQTLLLNLFITPSEHISKLKYEIACPPTVTCSQRGERYNQIARHKQRKLMFYFWVKPPYSLPSLFMQYEMQGKAYHHTLFLPISFNRFVKYTSKPPQINAPILLKTHTQQLNTKDFNSSQLASIFPDFTMHNEEGSFQLTGGGQYQGKAFALSFLLRDATHLQIRTQLPEKERECTDWVQFLMAVLLATLRK